MANKIDKNKVYSMAYNWANVYKDKYGFNPKEMAEHITAIVQKESNFDADAMNKNSTARGLTQILIDSQREIEQKHAKVPFAVAMYKSKHFTKAPYVEKIKATDKIFNPDYAIQLAVAYLGYQYKRYGKDWKKAVHAYNQGSWKADTGYGAEYTKGVYNNMAKLGNLQVNETMSSITVPNTTYVYKFS